MKTDQVTGEPVKIRIESVAVNGTVYQIQTLLNRSQFYDVQKTAEDLDIPTSEWSYFGMLWPAAHVLAEEMSRYPLEGLKVLEVGCGIGLASLVVQKRLGDIVASGFHPGVEQFLVENARLNELPPVSYRQADWSDAGVSLGRFDVVIGSDIVHDRRHPDQLARFIDRHLTADGEVVLVVPGREHCTKFMRDMAEIGFSKTEERFVYPNKQTTTCRGRILKFRRFAESISEV